VCQTQQIAIGPTGPTGTTGESNVVPGAIKAFTIFLDYTTANAISRVYIPAGLFGPANPTLAAGGVFTADQGTDLIFLGGTTLTMNNTAYPFVSGINGSGYIAAGGWQNMNAARLNAGFNGLYFSVTNDYSVTFNGLNLSNLAGGVVTKAPTGIAAGFVATITIFYV
jgi:hypothetical protein